MNNNRNNNNNRRRGRGNNNRQQGGQQLNRIDSRARGNAPQMLEKYRKLAHDSHLNGDRVTEEYYLQFADHYFRVIADQRARQEEQRQPRPNGPNDRPAEYGDDYAEDDFYGDANSPYERAGSAYSGGQNGNGGYPQNGRQDGNRQDGAYGQAQGRDGQARDGQGRDGQAREGQGRENSRENQGGQTQPGNVAPSLGGESRPERPRRGDRPERGERGARMDRPERAERSERPERAAEPAPVAEPQLGLEGEPSIFEPAENPFVREARPPRAPRARKPRRADTAESAAEQANLDPASLPPAISARREEAPVAPPAVDAAAEEAPAKPKRRTRRTTPPADDAAGALPETVS